MDIVVAGHICLDIIPDIGNIKSGIHDALSPGKLSSIGPVTVSTGGPVSNTGLALHHLGIPVRLMGKIGDDAFGKLVLDFLAGADVSLAADMIVNKTANTSYTIVINSPGIDRTFLHYSGANDTFTSSDVPLHKIKKSTLFHFGYPPLMAKMYQHKGDDLVALFEKAKNQGLITSLDMAFPDPQSAAGKADWEAILERVLPFVDIFLPSQDEIQFMLKTKKGLSEIGEMLLKLGVGIVVLKLGEKGLYLRTSKDVELINPLMSITGREMKDWVNRELYSPCYKVKVSGTTGAGDCTIAGFLAGLVKGLSPVEVLNSAVAVGAFSVEVSDSTSGVKDWKTTQKRIKAGWQKCNPSPDLGKWEKRPDSNVYRGPADLKFLQ